MKSMDGVATAQGLQKWIDERRCEHKLSQNNFGAKSEMYPVKWPQQKPEPFGSSLGEIKILWNPLSLATLQIWQEIPRLTARAHGYQYYEKQAAGVNNTWVVMPKPAQSSSQ